MYVWLNRVPDLAEVPTERAEQRDLAPREPGGEDEPVERVVLGAAVDDCEERLFEEPQCRGVDDRAGRRVQAEPLHPPRVDALRA